MQTRVRYCGAEDHPGKRILAAWGAILAAASASPQSSARENSSPSSPAMLKSAEPLKFVRLILLLVWGVGVVACAASSPSIARVWDEETLSAIRIDTPHPPVHARNLFSVSVAMYDAWAVYDDMALGYVYRGKNSDDARAACDDVAEGHVHRGRRTAAHVAAARREAISYAAYRILKERYTLSRSASKTLAALDARMIALGYDTNNFSLDTSTPAGVGNSVYAAVSSWSYQKIHSFIQETDLSFVSSSKLTLPALPQSGIFLKLSA